MAKFFPSVYALPRKYFGSIERNNFARRQNRASLDLGDSRTNLVCLHRNVSGIAPSIIEYLDADVGLDPRGPKEAGLLDHVDLPALEQHHRARPRIDRVRFHALFRIRHRIPIERGRAWNLKEDCRENNQIGKGPASHDGHPPQVVKLCLWPKQLNLRLKGFQRAPAAMAQRPSTA